MATDESGENKMAMGGVSARTEEKGDRDCGGEAKGNEVQQDDVYRCAAKDCVIIGWTTGAGPVDYVRRRRVSGVSYDSW